jgi:hypothetical protein
MISQFLEYLFITTVNLIRRRKKAAPVGRPTYDTAEIPTGYVVLGRVLAPLGQAPDATSQALLGAGIAALAPAERRRHLYILGATGTGKTNLLMQLIDADIKNHHAFCVIDLRGDLVDRILLRLAQSAPPEEWKQRLLLVDLRQDEQIVGFNPLLGEGNVYNRALHVLSVLKQQSESWGIQLEETLRNCLIALAQSGWSLLEIEPLLSNAYFRAEVLRHVTDTHVRNFFERFEQLSATQKVSWTLAVLNKVTPLLSLPQLHLLFGQRRPLSFRRLVDEQPGMIVLISLAVDQLHEAARLTGGLFVSAFQAAIMSRVDQPEAERVPVQLYVDEFETMATERFESIVAEGRRFGLGLCLSHQNISQMSTGLRHVLRNNVHTQIYFQTGSLDAAELAKEITGVDPGEDVRATLMTQGVGEAYLVRRGQPSTRIRTLHCPDPKVDPIVVRAIRQASLATYARPRAEVEKELKEREQHFKSLESKKGSSAKPAEIRHGKTTRFKPEKPAPGKAGPDRPQ